MGRGTPSKNGPNTSRNLQNKFGAFNRFLTISSKFDAKLLYHLAQNANPSLWTLHTFGFQNCKNISKMLLFLQLIHYSAAAWMTWKLQLIMPLCLDLSLLVHNSLYSSLTLQIIIIGLLEPDTTKNFNPEWLAQHQTSASKFYHFKSITLANNIICC